MLIMTFLLAIGASGWNIMGGYAGYISLGNSAFIGLGGYTTGILAVKHHVSPFIGCLAGGLVCALAAAAAEPGHAANPRHVLRHRHLRRSAAARRGRRRPGPG